MFLQVEEGNSLVDEEKKKISVSEVKKTIATALAAAFGFVIALLWNSVVVGGLKVAGVDPTLDSFALGDWIGYLITAIILTVVMVILIILVSRLGNK
jgi:ABC-type tungstate transport system substrate-binding protein